MRCESKTQREIAEHFGITQQRVSEILSEAALEITQAASEELRKVELDKLDKLEQTAHSIVERFREADPATVLGALDRLLKVQQRRAALAGLDAPQVVEQRQYSYSVNGVDPEVLK
jgi:predicted transcriptional regulator